MEIFTGLSYSCFVKFGSCLLIDKGLIFVEYNGTKTYFKSH